MVIGDFNIYYSDEPAYQRLLNQTNSGYVLDPIDSPGNWHNNISFADIHCQSTRTRQFGGGANGGMDDRFDMILISQPIQSIERIKYVSGTYTSYGNDGNHFNDSINAPPNTAVSQEIADALHYASDHIPIYAKFHFDGITQVESISSVPVNPKLFQNYPNPFNPVTTIEYYLPNSSHITLKLFDILGSEVKLLDSGYRGGGVHKLSVTAENLTSGVYYYRLVTEGFIETQKMIIMK
jgi:hypothetical protein